MGYIGSVELLPLGRHALQPLDLDFLQAELRCSRDDRFEPDFIQQRQMIKRE